MQTGHTGRGVIGRISSARGLEGHFLVLTLRHWNTSCRSNLPLQDWFNRLQFAARLWDNCVRKINLKYLSISSGLGWDFLRIMWFQILNLQSLEESLTNVQIIHWITNGKAREESGHEKGIPELTLCQRMLTCHTLNQELPQFFLEQIKQMSQPFGVQIKQWVQPKRMRNT